MTEGTEKTTTEDQALRRIRALLDKAENRVVLESEREALMAKAMQLMADYGINEAMASARRQTQEKIISRKIQLGNPYSYDKAMLAGYLAHELNCTQVVHRHGAVYVSATIMGYESDVVRLEMLYTSLLMQAMRQVRSVRPDWSYATPAETRAYRRNWFHGFNTRVTLRVRENEQRAAQKFEDEHTEGTGTALVITDRKTRVEAFKHEAFPQLGEFRRRDRTGDGVAEGVYAGNRADIGNDKVESGDQRKIGSGRG